MNERKITLNMQKTPQTPIGSGFGPRTTAMEALGQADLTGQTAVITGGHSGLGLETARVLAEAGAKVIVPARSVTAAQAAIASIPGAEAELLDLTDPQSIDSFAERWIRSGRPIHMLIHSAGIMAVPQQYDSRGNELHFSTNYLGPFQLTARLWPALRLAGGARVVVLSSRANQFSPVVFEDIHYKERSYDKWSAYGQSKTADALFAVEFDRRAQAYGVRAFSVHPGSIVTSLARHLSDEELMTMGAINEQGQRQYTEYDRERKTVQEGAATIVWCAASRQLDGMGGVYCENVDVSPLIDEDQIGIAGVHPSAVDAKDAERLWSVGEALTGIHFDIS